jgi:hypothetical protein
MLSKVVEVDLKFKMRFFWLQALHNTHKQQRTDFFFFLTDSKITSMHMSSSNVNICMKECVTEMKLILCVCVCDLHSRFQIISCRKNFLYWDSNGFYTVIASLVTNEGSSYS